MYEQFIEFITPSIVLLASSSDCYLSVRLPPASPPPTPDGRGTRRTINRGPFPFKCVRFESSSFCERSGCTIVAVKTCCIESGVYIVCAYSDGEVSVFCSKSLAETAKALKEFDENVNDESVAIISSPNFVCSFSACKVGNREDKKVPSRTIRLEISKSMSLLNNTFTFEIFTMNQNGQISHWGLACHSENVQYSLLGVRTFL